MMEAWSERPVDLANLLNPAFTGVLLRTSVEGYVKEAKTGMPYELAFLVLPFSMHHRTTERLPIKVTSLLQTWLQDNRDTLVMFPDRVRSLVPFTREAIVFACQRGILAIDAEGRLVSGDKKLKGITAYRTQGEEVTEAIKRSEFVGRWFALSGSPTMIYSLLGVRP
ncbi:MAG: DUF6521 family protein [Planctomycetota bacterium]|nr:DUF6521 family protein [Planctomycetota bacterium]